jgi:CDP-glucose 4,6-dehydratase
MFYSAKNLNIFKNKTVIITGNTGFKGSWLSLWLKTLGAKVVGISKDIPTNPSNFQLINKDNKIKNYNCDIKDFTKLKKIILKNKPDFFFHLAAQPLVKKSYINPLLTWNSNLLGTVNVLESLRGLKKKCVAVIITSDKSYKNLEIKRGYRENDILGGKDPYSASKASAELVIQSFINSYFKNDNKLIGVARAGNVVGGGDWSDDRLIPDCVKAWSKKKIVTIRNPNSTRPWQHVFEALRGYLILSKKLDENKKLHGEVFNFGPKNTQNKSVLELIIEMRKNWPEISWKIIRDKLQKYESNLLKLNSNKAKKFLRWEPKLQFNETIKLTTNWYKNFNNKKINIYDFSKNQIIGYIKK